MVMEEMHNELSRTGRAGPLTGLIWLLRRLRFVEGTGEDDGDDGSQPASGSQPAEARGLKRRRSTAGSQPESGTHIKRSRSVAEVAMDVVARMKGSGMQDELRLGKLQNVYMVKCGKVAVQSCRRLTGRPVSRLRLPASEK